MSINFFARFILLLCGLTSCARAGTDVRRTEISPVQSSTNSVNMISGRALFFKDCAHCHGADARGDDGPDLHKLDWTDEQIATRIRNGKKGQMTAFAGKLQPSEIKALVGYLQTLK